jgi:hypothetical protein
VTTLSHATYSSSLVFTSLKVSFTRAVPAHWSRAASFPLKRLSQGFYGFEFPS